MVKTQHLINFDKTLKLFFKKDMEDLIIKILLSDGKKAFLNQNFRHKVRQQFLASLIIKSIEQKKYFIAF